VRLICAVSCRSCAAEAPIVTDPLSFKTDERAQEITKVIPLFFTYQLTPTKPESSARTGQDGLKIHGQADRQLPPEQKFGRSNRPGRTTFQ
jgi:hypothetical protein